MSPTVYLVLGLLLVYLLRTGALASIVTAVRAAMEGKPRLP